MSVNTELKCAAEAVIAMNYPWEHTVRDGRLGKTSTEYARLAHPANILTLIADNERLDRLIILNKVISDSFRAERDQLRAEVAGLKTGYQAYEQVNAELKAENERLSASPERQIIRAVVTEAVKGIAEAATADAKAGTLKEIEQLKAECGALRKDAERYRWLQHGHSGHVEVVEWIGPHAAGMIGDDLDALVDAAMGKGEQS